VNKNLELFGIPLPEHPDTNHPDVSVFRQELIRKLLHLLNTDHTTLWNGLYRIDVSEQKVRAIFKGIPDSAELAEKLADLIIERQKQKWEIRQKYRDQSDKPVEGLPDGGDVPASE